ncbi:MGMT family protein [Glaciecola sp. MH2013]|uniref:MGMT family protein n=1 Tax=Glaciecola sp. MH2013 TaxID=2785524 RepID=UPI00189CE322|nr:MGMT family protein [Glaciecola sp. MH2013]MBF7072118.1 MGMT family protein [Glaciecola sp. MH2013]
MTISAQDKIWATVNMIPVGNVASYGQIADLAGLPGRARLVGKCLGQLPTNNDNSDMQVAWHRVLRANGQIAFAAESEQALKQIGLLQEENVAVFNNRVKLAQYQWQPELAELLFGLKY